MTVKMKPADVAWAKEVKTRDNSTCRRCGSVPSDRGLHAHHIFTRSRKPTRHELLNGVALCYGDHRWAHANPNEFHALMREQLGEAAYDALEKRSLRTKASAREVMEHEEDVASERSAGLG